MSVINHVPARRDPVDGKRAAADHPSSQADVPLIFVVEDETAVRDRLRTFLEANGLSVRTFVSAESFLQTCKPEHDACLLVDLNLRGSVSGLQLLERIKARRQFLPVVVFSSGGSDSVAMAVAAMKSGAADYQAAPIKCGDLLASIESVLAHSCYRCRHVALCLGMSRGAAGGTADLTRRQKEILALILSGQMTKNIAMDLGLSQRTVEHHRAAIMRKTGARSLAELARVSLATRWRGMGEQPPCFAA
jgi:two-component system CheB/CheR fusion protein